MIHCVSYLHWINVDIALESKSYHLILARIDKHGLNPNIFQCVFVAHEFSKIKINHKSSPVCCKKRHHYMSGSFFFPCFFVVVAFIIPQFCSILRCGIRRTGNRVPTLGQLIHVCFCQRHIAQSKCQNAVSSRFQIFWSIQRILNNERIC